MRVHTTDYSLLRSFFAFLTRGWSPRVDLDLTSGDDPEELPCA